MSSRSPDGSVNGAPCVYFAHPPLNKTASPGQVYGATVAAEDGHTRGPAVFVRRPRAPTLNVHGLVFVSGGFNLCAKHGCSEPTAAPHKSTARVQVRIWAQRTVKTEQTTEQTTPTTTAHIHERTYSMRANLRKYARPCPDWAALP